MTKRVLAFDFGASSGRAIIGCFDGDKITLEEVHRFCAFFMRSSRELSKQKSQAALIQSELTHGALISDLSTPRAS